MLLKTGDVTLPSEENHKLYAKYYELYKKLYPSLKENYLDLTNV